MTFVPLTISSADFIAKALPLLNKCYEHIAYTNPNEYKDYPCGPYRHLIAFGSVFSSQIFNDTYVFDSWQRIRHMFPKDWLFVFVSYDAKNSVETIPNSKEPAIEFNTASFFVPEHVWEITREGIILHKGNASAMIAEIVEYTVEMKSIPASVNIQPMVSKEVYIESASYIQRQLEKGNAYEVNFCIPFKGTGVIDPVETYLKLNTLSPMPFSCFFNYGDQYILCASPERFITKDGNTIYSQPIKGTSKRGMTVVEDEALKNHLKQSEKEMSENNMIVDLVRNDLSRSASNNSVIVKELRGIYSFPNVHQMISTIQSELAKDCDIIDAIKYAFPMGSMTGAPKIKAMQLIDSIEPVSRGPFSGTVGYMDPDNNVDFNVLIRSIFYNNSTQTVFMEAGSAITCYADPEKEYEECMLKITPIIHLFDL